VAERGWIVKTSPNGRAFIEAFEGKFLHTYDDGTGVLTIGYGHTSAAGPPKVYRGQAITDAECDAILATDLAAVEKNVERCIKVPMTQQQFDALVSFDFNTGSLAKSSIDDKINAANPTAAMATLLQYDHAGGRQMAGLTRRRQAEKLMFTGQVAASLKLAGAHAAAPDGPMPQAPTKAPAVILPSTPNPLPPDVPKPDPVPQTPGQSVLVKLIAAIFAAFFGRK
jgi:lysozyme